MPSAIARDVIFVADLFAFREVDDWSGSVREIARVWATDTPINYVVGVSVSGGDLLLVKVQRWDTHTLALLQNLGARELDLPLETARH